MILHHFRDHYGMHHHSGPLWCKVWWYVATNLGCRHEETKVARIIHKTSWNNKKLEVSHELMSSYLFWSRPCSCWGSLTCRHEDINLIIRLELLVTHGCSIKLINCTHVISCHSQSSAHASQGVEWQDILDPVLHQPVGLPLHVRVTPQLFHGDQTWKSEYNKTMVT